MAETAEKQSVWQPTPVQFLYRHENERYYVRTYAGGKEKWTSLRTKLISVAKNRMKEHLDAAERQKVDGASSDAVGRLTFGEALKAYRRNLDDAAIRPNTKAFREAGIKLVLRSWPGVEEISVRRISAKGVENWLREFVANAKPHIPPGAKSPSKVSTGASVTTIKCALDGLRGVLDVAVATGHLYANPARNSDVTDLMRKFLKASRRQRAENGPMNLPSKEKFVELVASIRNAGVAECRAAADYVEFIAFCGARKNEAANVLWTDIDFAHKRICLRVTKNGETRFLPMTEEMEQLLTRLRASQTAEIVGSVLRVKEAQGFINSACLKLGIPRFTTHALRHLFGTTCLEAGVDVRTVAGWFGHKDNGALLLKIYSHLRKDHEAAMIQKVRFGPVNQAAQAD